MTQDDRPQTGPKDAPDGRLTPETMVAYSHDLLSLAIVRISRALRDYEDVPLAASKELAEEFRSLRKAVEIAYHERAQLQKLKSEAGGSGGSTALDLGAARDEITRRLARLRDAERGGGISGQPE